MKKILLPLFITFSVFGYAQSIQHLEVDIIDDISHLNSVSTKSAICGPDTVTYPTAKATGFSALSINNATSAEALCQYYDAPQAITISGAEFFAYKTDVTGGTTINVNLELYAAGLDSMPTGAPLATTTVAVDTNFGGGALSALRKTGTFVPITMTVPYCVVVRNASPNGVGMISNDYIAGDGLQEWLSSADLGGSWIRSWALNIGSSVYDADFIVHPVVTYDLNADFLVSDPCMSTGPTVSFTNASSPVTGNKMYNQAAFFSIPELSYTWDFGDGSPVENVVDAIHAYGVTTITYDVKLTDTIYGWTSTCFADTTIIIGDSLVADFSEVTTGLNSTFSDLTYSSAGISSYLWDFGDGTTSTLANPVHNYATGGTYTVCLIVTNACGSGDTVCYNVSPSGCMPPVASFTITDNEPSYTFTNTSSINGTATYLWDMGESTTYATMDASHTYTANSSYTVTLIVSDSCGIDTVTQIVNVTILGLEDLSMEGLIVYPNPTNDYFNVQASNEIKTIAVYNLAGKIIFTSNVNSTETIVNCTALSQGIYVLSVKLSDDSVRLKRIEVVR